MVVASVFWGMVVIEAVVCLVPDLIPPRIRAEYFYSNSEGLPPGTVPDTEVGYKYVPNLSGITVPFGRHQTYPISTVSLGHEDIGFRDDGLDGEPFAIVLGDSLVACDGVDREECWVELLERKMGKDFANLGVSGYGPDLQGRMLNTYGLPLEPKLVVWVFFANDMIQGWRFNQFGQGAITEGEFWRNPVRAWLAKHSAIYLTLSYFWYERYFYRNLYSNNPTISESPNLAWWLAYSDLRVPEVAEGFERTKTIILEAHKQTHTELDNAEFVVVIIPFREQVLYADAKFQPVLDASNEALFDFCQQHGIPVIDTTAAVKEQIQGEAEPIFFRDSHLNERGNEVVAEILAQELNEMLPQQ